MIVWLLSLPALVVLLTIFAFVDLFMLRLGKARVLPWRRGTDNRAVSATGFEVLHASMSYGKAQELKERQTSLVLREDAEASAAPSCTIDLNSGKAVFRATPTDRAGLNDEGNDDTD